MIGEYITPDMRWVECVHCGRLMTLADVEWHEQEQCPEL